MKIPSKYREKFDILRMLRVNDSKHIKKGNFTIPITISESYMVKFTHTSMKT